MSRRYLNLTIMLFSCLFLWNQSMAAQGDAAQTAQELKNPDASAREIAMTKLVDKVAVAARPTSSGTAARIGNEAIPLLVQGLADSDERVRNIAIGGLAMIAASTERVLYPTHSGKLDITSYAPAREVLINAMSDADENVRVGAIRTYALSFKTTPEVEQMWINQFNSDQSEQVKKLILDAMVVGKSYSPQAVQFIVSQLQNPACAYDAAKAIALEMKPPPVDALPLLAKNLKSASAVGERDMYVRAIGAYREKGRPYLPDLRQLLTKENDPVVKGNLLAAIDRITGTTTKK